MHSLTSTLTLRLRLTLTTDTERCIRKWRRGDKSIWCVAVDVAADADAAARSMVWKGYPYCLNRTRMQRPGSK